MDVIKLKDEITKNGLTQREVAEVLGMSASTFRRKLREQSFGLADAKLMIELLNIKNPSEIFFDGQITL